MLWYTLDNGCMSKRTPPKTVSSVQEVAEYLDLKTDIGVVALEKMLRLVLLFDKKQSDYGKGNISKFGEKGVLVRVNDKVERLCNLLWNNKEPNFESVQDTWDDLAVYGVIGGLCHNGEWDRSSERPQDGL